jgi:hypothetical protein
MGVNLHIERLNGKLTYNVVPKVERKIPIFLKEKLQNMF